MQTNQRTNDGSPEWNQWLDFGVDRWIRFTVQVYNEDGASDGSMSSVSTNTTSPRTNVRKTHLLQLLLLGLTNSHGMGSHIFSTKSINLNTKNQ